MRLSEIEARKEATVLGVDFEGPPEAPKKVEWRKGKAREFIIGGLAFCVAYADDIQWTGSAHKPHRLLRLKGACLFTGYTGDLSEFRRKPNQPIIRLGSRAASPDEPKSTLEDLCQEIENITRITPSSPLRSIGTHLSLPQAFEQRRISNVEYLWVQNQVRVFKSKFPLREDLGAAAEDYAREIGLVFEGSYVEPGEEAKLEYSPELVQQLRDLGLPDDQIRETMELNGCAPPSEYSAFEGLEEKEEQEADPNDPDADLFR